MAKNNISKEIESKFGNHLRIRVNGILIEEEKILMVKHQMGNEKVFWSVPGGGMIYGQSAEENLIREFIEETSLVVEIKKYLFVNEFLDPPLHCMEHFFQIEKIDGNIALGTDPELLPENQILTDIRWMSINELQSLPNEALHPIFWGIKSLQELVLLQGYFNFENKSIK
jgi:8-oxo-dGTP diphosphatase